MDQLLSDDDVWEAVDFVGQPFSRIFSQPKSLPSDKWRICNTGTHWEPIAAKETEAVAKAYLDLRIPVRSYSYGSPGNADSSHLEADFLDGGLYAETGNYFCGERGAYITGPKAVLLIALQMGLRIRKGWREKHGVSEATFESLKTDLSRVVQLRRA